MTTFTRKDYLNAHCQEKAEAHRRYYGQFVTPSVIAFVKARIGAENIASSNDPHFNDIPLVIWDRLEPSIRDMCLSRMGDTNGAVSVGEHGSRRIAWSLSDGVCIAKEAARQIKESAR